MRWKETSPGWGFETHPERWGWGVWGFEGVDSGQEKNAIGAWPPWRVVSAQPLSTGFVQPSSPQLYRMFPTAAAGRERPSDFRKSPADGTIVLRDMAERYAIRLMAISASSSVHVERSAISHWRCQLFVGGDHVRERLLDDALSDIRRVDLENRHLCALTLDQIVASQEGRVDVDEIHII
jgi:hypothetical protein